jgi:hypothetical protein
LVERAIRNSSRPDDRVLDAFGGSATTLIAVEKSGRVARLMELDPRYIDVTVRRWQDWTGKFRLWKPVGSRSMTWPPTAASGETRLTTVVMRVPIRQPA